MDKGIPRKTKGIQGPTIKCKGLPEDSQSVIRMVECWPRGSGEQNGMRIYNRSVCEHNGDRLEIWVAPASARVLMKYANLQRDSKEYNEIPRNTKEYDEIPRNTREYTRNTK